MFQTSNQIYGAPTGSWSKTTPHPRPCCEHSQILTPILRGHSLFAELYREHGKLRAVHWMECR